MRDPRAERKWARVSEEVKRTEPPPLVARGDRARMDEVDRILEGEVETLNLGPGRPGALGA
jgi:hypothetical protein